RHVSLLAHVAQHARVRGRSPLRARPERPGAPGARVRRHHVQGVRPAGLRHARRYADGAGAGGLPGVPAERPGDPGAPLPQDRARLGGCLHCRAGGGVAAMSDPLLPREFGELEPWAATWCLATEAERWAERMRSSMAELRDFYDAFFPRAGEAIAHC